MLIFLFVILLIALSGLAVPGLTRRNVFTGNSLTIIQSIVFQRFIGVLLMLAALVMQDLRALPWISFSKSSVIAILIILLVVPPLARLISKRDKKDAQASLYSGLRTGEVSWAWHVFVTTCYMSGYEILLRGTFLFFLLDKFGVLWAIAINTVIYALMHVLKSRREAVLAIPFGIFLCWLTLYTKSVWPAAWFHLTMALSFEYFYSMKRIPADAKS